MRLVIRGSERRLRLASSFAASGAIHGLLLSWLVLASAVAPEWRPQTVYEQEIRPYESHLVWYSLGKKLPDVKPGARRDSRTPPRARTRSSQSIVAGKTDDVRPPQFIAMPAPAIELPKPLPLPNALAIAVPEPVRRFAPPPAARAAVTPAPVLPEAPPLQLSKTNPIAMATPAERPTRPFAPPPKTRPKTAPAPAPALPQAPHLAAPAASASLPVESPAITPQRAFSLPTAPAAPAAPPPAIAEAPSLPEASPTPDATRTLAIVGLKPADTPDLPTPPGSHPAGFSAGPKPRSSHNTEANESAAVTVPGLLTRSGAAEARSAVLNALAAPTSEQRLLAALRDSRVAVSAPAEAVSAPAATRVASAPDDGRLAGRYVYMIAISMPNVSSYSGSWIVWFAERRPETGDPPRHLSPPVAVHKVDPKYIRSAAEEGVEGIVRLAAVIRQTGAVDSVELLRHLDDRLDQSAREALGKWEFEPALRDGKPVDVDAIFEIPFRLAPKPKK
jgi:TonB family protein